MLATCELEKPLREALGRQVPEAKPVVEGDLQASARASNLEGCSGQRSGADGLPVRPRRRDSKHADGRIFSVVPRPLITAPGSGQAAPSGPKTPVAEALTSTPRILFLRPRRGTAPRHGRRRSLPTRPDAGIAPGPLSSSPLPAPGEERRLVAPVPRSDRCRDQPKQSRPQSSPRAPDARACTIPLLFSSSRSGGTPMRADRLKSTMLSDSPRMRQPSPAARIVPRWGAWRRCTEPRTPASVARWPSRSSLRPSGVTELRSNDSSARRRSPAP